MEKNNKVGFSFRFFPVENREKILIEKELGVYPLFINPYHRDTEKFVAVIELRSKTPYKRLYDFIERNPALRGRYGVYMYLMTKRNNDSVIVPDFVREVIHNTRGELDFSCGFMN